MNDTDDTMMTPDFIIKLASLAKLAYDDDYSKIDFLAVDPNYKKYVECSNSETTMKSFVVIDDTNKRLIVVFKGSKTFESYVADAMVSQFPNYEVYVCGHSLGGALATLFCYLVSCKNIPHLCTFGSPRVGNIYFSQ